MTGATTGAAVLRATVGEEPLDVAEHAALVEQAAAGAVVTFAGVVRDHDGGRAVRSLDYSAHPTAGKVVAEVAADIAARAAGVRAIAVSHRVGPLGVGDVALACCRGRRPPPGGVRHLRGAGRRGEAPATGVEAPVVQRRHRRMGRLGLTCART